MAELSRLLDLASDECEALVRRLRARGLVELVEADVASGVRITAKGERLLARMAGSPASAA